MSRGTRESESQNKGPGNAGSGESVTTPLVPASPENPNKGPLTEESGRVRIGTRICPGKVQGIRVRIPPPQG